jgi:hypothetical protein
METKNGGRHRCELVLEVVAVGGGRSAQANVPDFGDPTPSRPGIGDVPDDPYSTT